MLDARPRMFFFCQCIYLDLLSSAACSLLHFQTALTYLDCHNSEDKVEEDDKDKDKGNEEANCHVVHSLSTKGSISPQFNLLHTQHVL